MKIFNLILMGMAVMVFVILSNCTPKVEEEPTASQPDYVGRWGGEVTESTITPYYREYTLTQNSCEIYFYYDNTKITLKGGEKSDFSVNGNIMKFIRKEYFYGNSIPQIWDSYPTAIINYAQYTIVNNTLTIVVDDNQNGQYEESDPIIILTKK